MCCVFSCVLTVLRLAVADVTAVVRLRSPLLLLELSQPPSTGLALLENMPVRLRSNDISISDQREFLEFKCLQDGMVAVAACRYFSLPPPPYIFKSKQVHNPQPPQARSPRGHMELSINIAPKT